MEYFHPANVMQTRARARRSVFVCQAVNISIRFTTSLTERNIDNEKYLNRLNS